MAAAFALLFVVAVGGFLASLGLNPARRIDDPIAAIGCLPVVALFGVLLNYLVAKVIDEEMVPCVFVNSRSGDFASTRYRNLFGWDF